MCLVQHRPVPDQGPVANFVTRLTNRLDGVGGGHRDLDRDDSAGEQGFSQWDNLLRLLLANHGDDSRIGEQ